MAQAMLRSHGFAASMKSSHRKKVYYEKVAISGNIRNILKVYVSGEFPL